MRRDRRRGLFDTISHPPPLPSPHPFPLNDAIFIQQNVLVLAKWNDGLEKEKEKGHVSGSPIILLNVAVLLLIV